MASHHSTPKRCTDEELQRCRQNPLLADQLYPGRDGSTGLVICLECGLLVKRLVRSPNCHARRDHPDVDYPAKWPTAALYGMGIHEADLEQHYGYMKDNRDALNTTRRTTYADKLKKAAEDPTSAEAQWHGKELKRLQDRNQEVYYGGGDETVPGSKAAEKVRKHKRAGRENERQKELLEEWKAAKDQVERLQAAGEPVPPDLLEQVAKLEKRRKAHRDAQTKIRRLAKRPKCWNDLEPDKQAIWLMLQEHPEVKGDLPALGVLLDGAAIHCSFGDGTWTRCLMNKKADGYGAAKMEIWRIGNLK